MIKLFKNIIIILMVVIITYAILNIDEIKIIIQETIYPKKYSQEVSKYAKEYNVDEELIYAIIKAESNFNENVKSNKGAIGLMQLMYDTAKDVAKKIGITIEENTLYKPDININLGTKYISILLEKYGCLELALAAYNAGSGNVDTWINNGTLKKDGSNIENVPYKETNNYVRKILRDYKIYQEIYK